MKALVLILLLSGYLMQESFAQKDIIHGQASLVGSYSPKNDLPIFFGARYIPELRLNTSLDSVKIIDLVASANISETVLFSDFNRVSQILISTHTGFG